MKKTFITAALATLFGTPAIADAPATSTQPVAEGMTKLGFDLLSKLDTTGLDENIVLSPLSIDQCAALLYNGARGETQQKVAAALGVDSLSLEDANEGYLSFTKSLAAAGGDFDIANAVWHQPSEKLDLGYIDRCQRYLDANIQPLDFGDTTSAASTINGWVDKKTRHTIPTLVSADDLYGALVVLTNAVYFHGKWRTTFELDKTANGPFETPHGTLNVPLMHRDGSMAYIGTSTFQAVSLAYGNGDLQMLVALPAKGANVKDIVSNAWWHETVDRLRPTRLKLALPRFKAKHFADLTKAVQDIGIPLGGDYSGMANSHLMISKVLHKATIDVDEAGTVASAATAIVMPRGLVMEEPTMIVDRPFFFAIYDKRMRAVLFEGVIRDPSAG